MSQEEIDQTSELIPVIKPGGVELESEEDVESRLAYESLMRHRKKRRRKKIITACVLAGIVAAGGIAYAVISNQGSGSDDVSTLSTMSVYRSEFSESVSATGTAQALSSVAVTPEVDGTIEWVGVAEGDYVEEGQEILKIKNDDLDKAVRTAQIGLKSAQNAYNNALSTYNDAKKQSTQQSATKTSGQFRLADAETGSGDANSGNAGTDAGGQGGTVQTSDQADAVDLDALWIAVESAQLDLETAQESYDNAVAQAAKRTITAPQAGSVVSMKAVQGESVASAAGSSSLITIADLSQMTVKVQVNEVDISKISVGQEAKLTFSALAGVELTGQVTRISTTASGDENSYSYSGVVTYDVEVLIPEPTAELKPGMTANVEIMQQYVADAITVPVSALATDDGTNYYVYVLTDYETQACERRDVTLGAQSDTLAVVESGLNEGDELVLDPYSVANVADSEGVDMSSDEADAVTTDLTEEDVSAGSEGDFVATDGTTTEVFDGTAADDGTVATSDEG